MVPVTLVGESRESDSHVLPFTAYHISITVCPDSYIGK